MINSVTVTNHLGESITLDLRNPEESGFFIRGIVGLGPSKANIITTEILSSDGATFNSARVTPRNIVFDLGFLDAPTVEVVRQKCYKYFPIKKLVQIEVATDSRICRTTGYVESNDVTIFTKSGGASISVLCPDPYFYSVVTTETAFSSTVSSFGFPFENDSLTEKHIMFGAMHLNTRETVYYDGDADTGVVMRIQVLGSVGDITIYNVDTQEEMNLNSIRIGQIMGGQSLTTGDEVIITTVRGKKSIMLQRSGVQTNIMNALDIYASWFQLTKGDNVFTYTASSGAENLQFKVEHQTLYEGV